VGSKHDTAEHPLFGHLTGLYWWQPNSGRHLNRKGGHHLLTRTDIETIIWQDEEISRLRKRVKNLETSYLQIIRINTKLRNELDRLKSRQNRLNEVNV
jgi:succinate dehydrogenase/fumarate reductase flavoprotein subunit